MLNFDKFYMTSPASAGLFAFQAIRESPLQGYLTLWRRWGWGPASRDSYCLEQRSSSPYKDRSSCKGERFLFSLKFLKGCGGTSFKKFPHVILFTLTKALRTYPYTTAHTRRSARVCRSLQRYRRRHRPRDRGR